MLSCNFVHPLSSENVIYPDEVGAVIELRPWILAQWMKPDSVNNPREHQEKRLAESSQISKVRLRINHLARTTSSSPMKAFDSLKS